MYNPATGQEHEYIEIHNIGASVLDLTDVRFTDGISFDFPGGTTINPGAYALVVKDPGAFEILYGPGLPVIGNYGLSESASLSNGGEGITLSLGTTVIHEFEYNDRSPWPVNPDGSGSALALFNTSNNGVQDVLGHGVAANWRQGLNGGTPGTAEPSSPFTGDPTADDDADGLSAFLEHALGSSDTAPGSAGLVVGLDGNQMTLTFPRNPLATDVLYSVETSLDLKSWTTGAVLDSQDATMATYLLEASINTTDNYFMRLRVEQISILQQ